MINIKTVFVLLYALPIAAMENPSGFEPIVGNGSQEVELGTSFFSFNDTLATPVDILADRIKYLPEDIKAKAFAHFEQLDDIYKGNVTIDDAAHLAKLYQHEAEQRLKKEQLGEKPTQKTRAMEFDALEPHDDYLQREISQISNSDDSLATKVKRFKELRDSGETWMQPIEKNQINAVVKIWEDRQKKENVVQEDSSTGNDSSGCTIL